MEPLYGKTGFALLMDSFFLNCLSDGSHGGGAIYLQGHATAVEVYFTNNTVRSGIDVVDSVENDVTVGALAQFDSSTARDEYPAYRLSRDPAHRRVS